MEITKIRLHKHNKLSSLGITRQQLENALRQPIGAVLTKDVLVQNFAGYSVLVNTSNNQLIATLQVNH